MSAKSDYILNNWRFAYNAAKKFDINPVVILAQGGHESAWGTSYGARNRKNHFGITAGGSPNEYWSGAKSASTTNPNLVFRIYKTDQDSYYDFARLIRSKYTAAANKSYNVTDYASLISNSPYISEANGDNRAAYKTALINNSKFVAEAVAEILSENKTPILLTLTGLGLASFLGYKTYQYVTKAA